MRPGGGVLPAAALILALLGGVPPATGQDPIPAAAVPAQEKTLLEYASDVQNGEHWRLLTSRGVVHVWREYGYDPARAGIVVYLHGHHSSADRAWSEDRLAAQFRAARLNALFIVPESTRDGEEPLRWESVDPLLAEVAQRIEESLPPGPLVVMGHSGAFRNIAPWLAEPSIEHVILLDGLYGMEDEFFAWITASPGHARKQLTLVSRDTRGNALRFMKKLRESVGVRSVPRNWTRLPSQTRRAQVVNLRSQYAHHTIVNSGVVIPVVLKRARLDPIVKVAMPLRPGKLRTASSQRLPEPRPR